MKTPLSRANGTLNKEDSEEQDYTVVKALDKDIFMKNKHKSESFVHHADILLPRVAQRSNGSENSMSKANYMINMIQKIANNSISIPQTSTGVPETATEVNSTK